MKRRAQHIKPIMHIMLFAFLVSVSIALSGPAASAETTVLRFDFDLHSNDTVELAGVLAAEGTFEEGPAGQRTDAKEKDNLSYQLLIVEEENVLHFLGFDVNFLLMTDPPQVVDRRIISKKVPYFGNIGTLMLYHNDRLIFDYDLEKLCNHDTVCNGFENEITCAQDCVPERRERAERIGQIAEEKGGEILEQKAGFVSQGNRQFLVFISIVCMILALLLAIILTKHKKMHHGKRK